MKRAFAGLHDKFHDVRVYIEDMVAVRLTFCGTHAPSVERAVWPEKVFVLLGGQGGGELGADGHWARLGQSPW